MVGLSGLLVRSPRATGFAFSMTGLGKAAFIIAQTEDGFYFGFGSKIAAGRAAGAAAEG